jgi:hypothetical protein
MFLQEYIFSKFLSLRSDVDKASVLGYDAAETITVSQNIGNETLQRSSEVLLGRFDPCETRPLRC